MGYGHVALWDPWVPAGGPRMRGVDARGPDPRCRTPALSQSRARPKHKLLY